MKKIILLLITIAMPLATYADQYVHGYQRKNGTYVDGYHRTWANDTRTDNYSYHGNTNPYTGQRGYKY